MCILLIIYHYASINKVIIAFTPIILLVVYWYCWIRFGNSIRLIQNDFIGLLKGLGIFNIIATLSIPLGVVSIFSHSNIFTILTFVINIPPLVILIIIYNRAITYTKKTGTINPE